jgi:hypothetical protein
MYNTRLKAAIKDSGRVQWYIARNAGLTPWLLSKIINGHFEPTPEHKQAIAKALSTSPSQLF